MKSRAAWFSMKICVFFATAANVFRIANGITNLETDVPCGIDLSTIHSKFGQSRVSARTPRIINGVQANRLEFPWIVSFQFKKSKRHFCSGFVINKRYILSALHCFVDDNDGHVLPLRILKARLGEHDLTQNDVNTTTQRNVYYKPVDYDLEEIIGHPYFQPYDHLHDIALIRLSKDIEWSAHIRPICLPSNASSLKKFTPNQLATISGWGSTTIEQDGVGKIAKVLQKSRVRIVERRQCENWLSQSGLQFTPRDSHVCAGYEEGGTDACWGDSGGPLQIQSDVGSHKFFAMGIVSAGKSCALPRHPTVYTSVEFYMDWIKQNIEE